MRHFSEHSLSTDDFSFREVVEVLDISDDGEPQDPAEESDKEVLDISDESDMEVLDISDESDEEDAEKRRNDAIIYTIQRQGYVEIL